MVKGRKGKAGKMPNAKQTKEGNDQAKLKIEVFHAITSILDGIYEHVSPYVIHSRILETAIDLTRSDFGLIGELNPDGKFDTMALEGDIWSDGHSVGDDDVEMFNNMPVEGLLGKIIKGGEPQVNNVLRKALEEDRLIGLPEGTKAIEQVLAVPFKVLGKTMGVMALANKEGGFTDEDKEVLVELSYLVSMSRSKLMALDRAIRKTGDGIAIVDRNGVLSSVNPAMESMFKYKASEIEGRSLLGLFLDIESASPLGEAIAGVVMEGAWTGEAMALRRDGSRFPVHLSLTAIDEESSPRIGFMAVVRDISAEKEAKGMAELYLETAGVMILALDLEGNVTMMNHKGEEVLGWTKEELYGKDWFDNCVPETNRKKIRRVFELLLKPDKKDYVLSSVNGDSVVAPVESQIYSIVDKRGQERIIHWQYSLLRNMVGLVVGVLGSGNDITERTHAVEKLRGSEEMYKSLIRASPDSITVSDLEGNIIEVSQAAMELHGTDNPDDMIGKNALEMMVPEDHVRAMSNLRKTLEEGSAKNLEYKLIRKDGSTYTASLSSSLVRDADGNPKSFIAIVRDITDRKMAEELLREAEERYRSLFERLPIGIIRTRLEDSKILMANQVAALTMGYTNVKDFIEKHDMSKTYPPEERKKFTQRLMRYGEVRDMEMPVVTIDGTKKWLRISARLDPTGQFIDSSGVEITDVKVAQEELQKAEELFRSIFENAPVAIARIDAETMKPILINEYAAKKLGFSSLKELEAEEGLDLANFIFNDEDDALAEKLFQGGILAETEVQIQRKDGTLGWFLSTLRFYKDSMIIDSAGVDITKQKEVEERLRDAEEKYRSIFENSHVGFLRTDIRTQKIILANRAAAGFVGYDSVDEFIMNAKTADLYHPEDRKRLLAEIQRTGKVIDLEVRHITPEGDTRYFIMNAEVDPTGQFIDASGIEITEMKKAQTKLDETEKRYRSIIENSPIGIIRTDMGTGRVVLANEHALQILGYGSIDALMTKIVLAGKGAPPGMRAFFERLRKEGRITNYEARMRKDDGSPVHVLINAVMNKETGISDSILVDITDWRSNSSKGDPSHGNK